ncbi:MAG: hypothetical protein U0M42_03390 [Acutalibacteraceae bacterium]|nr:hypothetical protein [Acutalibacteraceae bacterium]
MKYVKNIAQRVEKAQERAAVIYAKTDGKLFKWLRILYIIAMSVAILMSALYIGSRASHLYELKALNLEVLSDKDITSTKTSIITVGVVLIFWLISFIFIKLKKEIISLILTLVPGIVSCASLISASQNTSQFNEGITTDFWLRHFIPLLLALLFIVWMVIIKVRAERIFKTAYNNMTARIYELYGADDLSEEQWESFLESYHPRAEEEKRRRQKSKQKEYTDTIISE